MKRVDENNLESSLPGRCTRSLLRSQRVQEGGVFGLATISQDPRRMPPEC